MNTTDDKYDIKFKELFQKTGAENPSEGFTSEVMKKIEQLDAESKLSIENNKRINWYWVFGISLLVLLGASLIHYFDIGILPENSKLIIAPVFERVVKSFDGIFESVQISSTTIVIILGFVLLVVLERLLHKLNITKNIYFSF